MNDIPADIGYSKGAGNRTCSDCPREISCKSNGRCRACSNAVLNKTRVQRVSDIPEGFAEFVVGKTLVETAAHYGICRKTASRWRAEVGVPSLRPGGPPPLRPAPADFAKIAEGKTVKQIAAAVGAGHRTVERWLRECSIVRFRRQTKGMGHCAPVVHDTRDHSVAGQAADYLRRFGPVVRCNAGGRYDPKGDHWRRGSTVLTPDEIIARAERQGWAPDAWSRLAA